MANALTDTAKNAMERSLMRKPVIILAIVLSLIVGAGIAYASIPGPDGTIHGCYKTSNPAQGALIAIDSAASCPSGYTALNWSQTGPQGPAGANGVSGYVVVSANSPAAGPNDTDALAQVTCPQPKVVLGGGAYPNPNGIGAVLTESRPDGDGVSPAGVDPYRNVWSARYKIPLGSTGFQTTVYAICATVS